MTSSITIDTVSFHNAFEQFRGLIESYDKGHPFTNFHEGLAAAWEEYKPRLRDRARQILAADGWAEAAIGAGDILDRVIASIEIQETKSNLINNLVFWQNRYGHANQEHRALLEARTNPTTRSVFERLLFDLYRTVSDEGATFERLSSVHANPTDRL
jgi:hypothetical protein